MDRHRHAGGLTAPGGLVISSLRRGAGASRRRVYEVDPEDTIAAATGVNLSLVRRCPAPSVQAAHRDAAVHWTWLAFAA